MRMKSPRALRAVLASAIASGLVAAFGLQAGAQGLPRVAPADGITPRPGAPTGFESLAQELMPAVVNISTSSTILENGLPQVPQGSPLERFNEFFGRDGEGFRQEGALGSGFVISADGMIVTNNHVIENADDIEIEFSDGRRLPARLIGTDPDTDLALLKVEPGEPLSFVSWGNSDGAQVGSWVLAIGNPFGLGGSVSAGIVSARSRDINAGRFDDFIQTDAAINRGNSGGPLFNMKGEVIGVNTMIFSQTGGSVGIGFSVPSNMADYVVRQLQEHGRVKRGWLGVNIQPVDEALARSYGMGSARGVIVTTVTPDSPASEAGLEVGDLIVEIGGQPVRDSRALTRIVAETPIGAPVRLDVIRDCKSRNVTVTLREREDESTTGQGEQPEPMMVSSSNALGVDLVTLNDDLRRRYGIPRSVVGVVVDRVSPRSPAAGKLRRGDVIVEMDFEAVATIEGALDAITAAGTEGTPLLLRVMRSERDMFYSIELE